MLGKGWWPLMRIFGCDLFSCWEYLIIWSVRQLHGSRSYVLKFYDEVLDFSFKIVAVFIISLLAIICIINSFMQRQRVWRHSQQLVWCMASNSADSLVVATAIRRPVVYLKYTSVPFPLVLMKEKTRSCCCKQRGIQIIVIINSICINDQQYKQQLTCSIELVFSYWSHLASDEHNHVTTQLMLVLFIVDKLYY